MTNEFDNLFGKEDGEDTPLPEGLASLRPIVDELTRREAFLAAAEVEVSEAKERIRAILYTDLPAIFDELGISSFTTSDGRTIDVKPFVSGSIIKGSEDGAHAWLTDNGYADLIKHEVSVKLPAGDSDIAEKIVGYAGEQGVDMADKYRVHPSTLKAFLRDCDEQGVDLPDQFFRIYRGSVAKIR